ncbi:hypothetical protein JW930_05345 [Candidatus Woesearchaeota archaeon]|nr:hypothetical protein [Candidatus Woesearchaeota archaeon]
MKHRKIEKRHYTQILRGKLFQRILIGTILILLLSIFVDIKLVIFLSIAVAFNAYLALFQLKRGLPTDFELSTFAAVLTTMAFGIKWGLFIAIFSKLIASIYSGSIIVDHIFMIITYCIAALATHVFRFVNVKALGMAIVVMNCIIMFLVSHNVLRLDPTTNISYTSTNFVFNTLVFMSMSEIVLKLLTL